jgi:O-antigen/teichoic acid export membrane protein
MTGVRRSMAFSFLEKYSVTAINLAMTAILARLLTPEEVGVFMVGFAVVMLTAAFRDFGVSVYLIQEREITPEGVRTAFTVTLMLSLLFAGLLYGLAGSIAAFYDEQGLQPVLRIIAIGFLLAPFSAPIMALLRRDMGFDKIAVISVTGAAVNFVAVVVLAALGFGYLSLAWASLLAAVTGVMMAFLYRPDVGIFRPTLVAWRKVCSFGGYSTATTLLNMFHEQLPQLLLGRILGFQAVGLYSRALMLCQLPERLIHAAVLPVVLPALTAQVRSGSSLKEPYLQALAYNTALQWPFLLCIALLANPIVKVVLGEQWMDVAPLLRIMALAWLFLFPAFMTYPVLVSLGRVKDTLTASLISLPPSIAVISGAAFIGLEAVAASLFLTAPFQVYVALWFIRRQVPFRWRELLDAVRNSALVGLCAAVAPAVTVALAGFRFDLSVLAMVLAVAGAAIGWAGGLLLTGHPLLAEARGATRAASALRPLYLPSLSRGRRPSRVVTARRV